MSKTAPLLVPGTTVVALLLATGRWGSYLGYPSQQVYLTEVCLACTLVWTLLRHYRRIRASRRELLLLAPVGALVLLAAARLAFGSDHSTVALRDYVPYAYPLVAALALVQVGTAAVRRTQHVLGAALVIHLLWVTASVLDRDLPLRMPLLGGRVHVLELRPDFDGAVLAVLLGLALQAAVTTRSHLVRGVALVVSAWSALLVLQLANRGALLAVVLVVLIVTATHAGALRRAPARWSVPALAGVLAAAVIVVPRTELYARLTGSERFDGNTAGGTSDARLQAWRAILELMDDSVQRVLGGVGFGPDFLEMSGMAYLFVGSSYTDVRAPHNYLINTYARLGAVGATVLLVVLLVGLVATVACLRHDRERYLPLALVCGTVLMISMVGVDLESPFGAVPFFWALGQLLVGRAEQEEGAPSDEVVDVPAVGRGDAVAQADLGLPAQRLDLRDV